MLLILGYENSSSITKNFGSTWRLMTANQLNDATPMLFYEIRLNILSLCMFYFEAGLEVSLLNGTVTFSIRFDIITVVQ